MTTATAAAAAPREQQGQAEVPVPVNQRDGAHDGADGGEGHLTEADLARPAGEHDDRTAHDGEDDEGRGPDELAGTHPQGQRAGSSEGHQNMPTGCRDPHLGEAHGRTARGRARCRPTSASSLPPGRLGCATNWRTTTAAKTTPARTASPSAGFVGLSQATPCWSTPERDGGRRRSRASSTKLPSASAASAVTSAVSP